MRRQRYIGFIIQDKKNPLSKENLIMEIQNYSQKLFQKTNKEMGIRLMKYTGFTGILRCNHMEKDNIITILRSISSVKIQTIATSGTIKSLIRKHMNDFLLNF
jgi:RNase P/RNase MRP subunit POP5